MSNRVQHYVRTSQWLNALSTLKIGEHCRLRCMQPHEADRLAETLRKRSPGARMSGQRDFYYRRAKSLANKTVIEIVHSGPTLSPQDLKERALIGEQVVASSLILTGSRRKYVRSAVGVRKRYLDLNILQTASNINVSSTSQNSVNPVGLTVDDAAVRRYTRNGFSDLYKLSLSNTKLSSRVRRSLTWLLSSRTDPSATSAIVKTATALESLIVIGREHTTRALSERSAYLLSGDPSERVAISRATKRFYSMRGDVVHGKELANDEKLRALLEFGDRLTVLLALVLAANRDQWQSEDDVRAHCDNTRWGHSAKCTRPWSKTYLNVTLSRAA